ncbi:MAG: GNAT family N-acetyltransferase, partial [Flavobacteriaceae bacterium]|nr:GNAT family N-acetyltransferase [Flavobacteriaceae bacterium]
IYYAVLDDNVVGFVQLYPLFSSVSMKPMLLLNDLYVKKEYRDRSIGTKLIDRAKKLCQQTNQKGMAIETAQSNRAQELYQRLGFKKDENLHLFWTNK